MKIGDRTLEGIERQVDALLKDYLEDIDAAYCRCENDLTIGIRVKLEPSGSGTKITTALQFTASKIKDSVSFSVDEQQIGLPFPETEK